MAPNDYPQLTRRLDQLSSLGAPSLGYLGFTHFDGEALERIALFDIIVPELVAPCRPNSQTNDCYGGLFGAIGPLEEQRHYLRHAASLIPVIDEELGIGIGSRLAIDDYSKPENIEVHLLSDPRTGIKHAFFLPSRKFINYLRARYVQGGHPLP